MNAALLTVILSIPILVPLSAALTPNESPSGSQRAAERVPELGRVHFGRDVEAGLKNARASKLPLFLLFQEIPGCATCRNFGGGPLSHPLLVEAIETSFVPVVVHNNGGGADALALERFHEPAWNNPIVRFLDADGHDLIAREEGVWGSAALAPRLVRALEKSSRTVPSWLRLAAHELAAADAEHAVFAMHCFWEGQAALGGLDGVIDARPGFVDGAEVVDVQFLPAVISFGDLVRKANALDCALKVHAATEARVLEARAIVGDRARRLAVDVRAAKPDDDLRHVRHARGLDLVPMTRVQALRINAALAQGASTFDTVLSPRQTETWRAIEGRLSQEPSAFDGLARPDDVRSLGTYADEVEARLARTR